MKLPLSWLKEHTAIDDTVENIAAALVRLGHEVEGIEAPRAAVKGVVVGHILSKDPHPDADKLSLLKIDIDADEPLAIVCGASNMGAGDKVPVATIGTSLPNGLKIKKGKIRGETSFGMCCSEAELGLAEDAAGLLILPKDAPVGMEVGDYLELEEAILDLSITPNRGDCMSVHGLARDLAADYGVALSDVTTGTLSEAADVAAVNVHVSAEEDCPLYLGRRISGVQVGESPAWMQQRLIAAGMRPVNGVVDVLNYIMLDMGQPMHAFDAAKLSGDIYVRAAAGNEAFHALDGRKLKLNAGELVIADGEGVVALAGIMGSEPSGVTESTTEVVLESAFFRPAQVSITRRTHGMVSEASMRFERGVDAAMVEKAMNRATAMIVELFGGKAGSIHTVGDAAALQQPKTMTFAADRMSARLGIAIDEVRDDVLRRMGFGVTRKGGELTVEIPSHRHDVSLPEDISEEYARIIGYDAIPAELPALEMAVQAEASQALPLAVQGGFNQVISYAFISKDEQRLFSADEAADIVLANPISEAMAVMRHSIWPGLLGIARHNLNRQQYGLALVEQGRSYVRTGKGIDETNMMAWLMAGEVQGDAWYGAARSADFFDLKGAVEGWLARMGVTPRFVASDAEQGLQAGQTAKIVAGRSEIGRIGKVDGDIAATYDIDLPVYVAEVNLDALPKAKAPKFAPLPEFPSTERDLVFLFDKEAKAEDIVQAVRKAGGKLLSDARIFDRYVGKGVPEGKVSLGVRFVLQAPDRTLTQEDSDAASQAVVAEMEKRFGAVLRG
jgi:phenylalanyl-tRNA synthetase beta chain